VKDYHSYYVSDLGIWTHNSCKHSRKGAFNAAKRDAGIARSQQPYKVGSEEMRTAAHEGSRVIKDKKGKIIKTKEYYYTNKDGEKITIQDHRAGHKKGGQGPHFMLGRLLKIKKERVKLRVLKLITHLNNKKETRYIYVVCRLGQKLCSTKII
jgi:hypothetical protein